MSDSGPTGLLTRLEEDGQVMIVPMGEVYPVDFQTTPAIGTSGLGSCSVAAIVSAYGAILAHIPPRPLSPAPEADPYAGDNNVRAMMQRVRELYEENEHYFPFANTVVVCAVYNGEVALPDQMGIMQEAFRDMGLESATHTYNVPGDRTLPGQGTVIVVSSFLHEETAGIYVEDNLVTPMPSVAPDMFGEEDTLVMDQAEASATSDYEPGQSAQEFSSAVDVQMTQDEDIEAPASRKPKRTWVEVHVTIVPHMTRRDEYVFTNAKRHSVSTDRSNWEKGTHDGQPVWLYKGKKTVYYTYQKIKQ
ncbi:hypothetical protein CONLIGDRAFT_668507 [Coniochaeta ligniaria NRRL 30616]|uniref:Uncharacterized protein n=1 Tax=Coniochaeta ligniaria NRRL 30616 TaxID=1408157 RepID=A0A1J7ITK6_9PEZI|nr:hypothetical protein CONLIGDRAFT_668507 [Coniochaeta ligniaria NRRL 30616]